MSDYEKLLPIDPIGALEKIKENYRRYFATMYKFREQTDHDVDADLYENLNERKEQLWDPQNGTPRDLYNDPYVELLPEYESSGETLGELLQDEKYRTELGHINPHFVDFIKAGLMPDQPNKPYKPYKHQIEMLLKAFGNHGNPALSKNVVVTSGTGSGKTEAFLLPLFASLLNEAQNWGQSHYNPRWFSPQGDEYNAAYQRQDEAPNRKAAIRAMIMYPMNALVEDQVARLREALDSDAARQVLDNHFNCNRIFFGRYTGSTIGSKSLAYHESKRKKDRQGAPLPVAKMVEVKDELAKLADKAIQLQNYIADTNNDPKAEYISPRLGVGTGSRYSAEMITRWDMQECPPDILITNVAMLNIMLMREAEKGMLQKTRDWYTAVDKQTLQEKEQAKKERIFHLIVDELHLYRGTAGTEVSYLLRMFLDRIGVPPTIADPITGRQVPNPQLRILASSASLGDTKDETIDYLEQFFGVYYENPNDGESFQVQDGDPFGVNNSGLQVPYAAFDIFAQRVTADGKERVRYIYDPQSKDAIKSEFIQRVNEPDVNSITDFLRKYAGQIYYDLQSLTIRTENGSSRYVPISINALLTLFDNDINILRGFFIFRGDDEVCRLSEQFKLPRMRFHQFFKYVEGLWGELLPRENDEQRAIGRVMLQSEEYDPQTSHKVLELLRCEICGEVFIGGNRSFNGFNRDTFVLSLNSPVLTSIPNRNPTPMVQEKMYKDYGVFWPTLELPRIQNKFFTNKFNTANNNRKTAYTETQSEGRWVEGYLNPYDGTIQIGTSVQNTNNVTNWIHGFVYMIYRDGTGDNTCAISNNEETQMALPCLCPHCNADYHYRKYSKSPIRSFRSGFKRSNQILSKELMYQLPDNNRKLIGFSDSRQDAAEQSYGIAQEHYRDMVRLAFLQSLDERGRKEENALTRLKKDLCRDIEDLESVDDMIDRVNNAKFIKQDTKDELIQILQNNLADEQKKNAINAVSITTNIIPLDEFIGESLNGYVVKKLLDVKTNPAGIDLCDQTYYANGQPHYWTDLYDFNSLQAIPATDTNYSIRMVTEAKNNLKKVLFQICVGKYMGITTEDAGIGYLTLPKDYVITDQTFLRYANQCACNPVEIINAYIRIFGDNYRYESNDIDYTNVNPNTIWNNYSRFSDSVKHPLEVISAQQGIDHNDFGRALYNVLWDVLRLNDLKLNWPRLSFKKVDLDSAYYKCPTCGRIHLHRGLGICTNTACCDGLVLVQNSTVKDIYKKHYIAYDTKVEPRNACRIHTEELTGQTDDQPTRLLEFKGIILDRIPQEAKNAKVIDMVNVTTTMEVGVDIGGLLAVYQGNMPPTRYNYQQRVGRGGRRGQAFSMAMTFCRGRSHDTYYYDKGADEMTGGLPALPKLSIKPQNGIFNDAIVRRVLLKHILRLAYLEENLCTQPDDNIDSDSTKLELGLWKDWYTTIRPALKRWIGNNHDIIENTVDLYLKQYVGEYNNDPRASIIAWIQNDRDGILNAIDNVESHKQCESIAQDLVESGILPIYGLPSSQRDFYHSKENRYDEVEYKVISRSLEESISEFAPGAIKIKDHGYYKSDGLTVPLKSPKYNNYQEFDEDYQRWDALENSYSILYNGDDISSILLGYNAGQNNICRLVIPKAYRTLRLDGNAGKLDENEDRSHYSSTKIWVDDTQSITQGPRSYKNLDLTYWNSAASDNPIIWFINDNNGRKFNGSSQFALDNGISTNPKFFNRNIANYNQNNPSARQFIDHAPNFMTHRIEGVTVIQGAAEDIVLGAKKVTELLKLKVSCCPNSIELRLRDDQGNAVVDPIIAASIKAAYYSAATLIQRYFADEQDIQPEEVQISEVQIDSDGFPYIYLSDALANGSGYMKLLQDLDADNRPHIINIMEAIVNGQGTYMQSLMSDEHKAECKSSCAKCLRTYQNQGYHHVLDWRLGIDLIKLMLDPNYDMGQTIPAPYGDLEGIFDEVGIKVQNANSALGIRYDNHNKCFIRQGYDLNDPAADRTDIIEMLVHPLWKHDSRLDQNVFQLLRGIYEPKAGRKQMYKYISSITNIQQPITTTGRNLLG